MLRACAYETCARFCELRYLRHSASKHNMKQLVSASSLHQFAQFGGKHDVLTWAASTPTAPAVGRTSCWGTGRNDFRRGSWMHPLRLRTTTKTHRWTDRWCKHVDIVHSEIDTQININKYAHDACTNPDIQQAQWRSDCCNIIYLRCSQFPWVVNLKEEVTPLKLVSKKFPGPQQVCISSSQCRRRKSTCRGHNTTCDARSCRVSRYSTSHHRVGWRFISSGHHMRQAV